MENSSVPTPNTVPTPTMAPPPTLVPTPVPPPAPSQPKKSPSWAKMLGIALLLAAFGGGLYFLGQQSAMRTAQTTSSINENEAQASPSPTIPSANVVSPNQLRIGQLQLPYPEDWIPVMINPQDTFGPVVYFTKDAEEAKRLESCAARRSCTQVPLTLEDLRSMSVWETHTIEEFIRQVESEIKVDQLQKTNIGGREAWLGFTNADQSKHTVLISMGQGGAKAVGIIHATATDKAMMAEYVAHLANLGVLEDALNRQEISPKKGFEVSLKSSLIAEDYFLLMNVLQSWLAPVDSDTAYHVSVYTGTTENPNIGIPAPEPISGNLLNRGYYLLTDNAELKPGTYGTDQIQVTLSESKVKNLGNYLDGPKYCERDSDCQYRMNFCTFGAYNEYHAFGGDWGCGMPEYEGLGVHEEVVQKYQCKSDFDVTYDAVKCVSNTCQMINPQPVCK